MDPNFEDIINDIYGELADAEEKGIEDHIKALSDLLNKLHASGYACGLADGYKIGLDENFYSILKNTN